MTIARARHDDEAEEARRLRRRSSSPLFLNSSTFADDKVFSVVSALCARSRRHRHAFIGRLARSQGSALFVVFVSPMTCIVALDAVGVHRQSSASVVVGGVGLDRAASTVCLAVYNVARCAQSTLSVAQLAVPRTNDDDKCLLCLTRLRFQLICGVTSLDDRASSSSSSSSASTKRTTTTTTTTQPRKANEGGNARREPLADDTLLIRWRGDVFSAATVSGAFQKTIIFLFDFTVLFFSETEFRRGI